jgi:oligopeptide transport system substrate-binding protein
MKKILVLFLSVVTVLSLTACRNEDNSDVWREIYAREVASLNQYLIKDSTGYLITANIMDGLLEVDKYGTIQPSLAESYTVTPDFTEWTFKLREGVFWIDNTGAPTEYEVTANDFLFAVKYLGDPNNQAQVKTEFDNVALAGFRGYYNALVDCDLAEDVACRNDIISQFDTMVGVEVIDKYTIKYQVGEDDEGNINGLSYFDTNILGPAFYPLNEEFYTLHGRDYGLDEFRTLYSGAYYVSDWTRDKEIILKRNESYWDIEKVHIKEINMQKVADSAIGLQLFQRGEVSSVTVDGQELTALQKSSKWNDKIYLSDKGKNTYWFALNFGIIAGTTNSVEETKLNPEFNVFVQNKDFRKALYHSMPKELLLMQSRPTGAQEMIRNTISPENYLSVGGVDYTDLNVIPDCIGCSNYPSLQDIKNSDPYDEALAIEYLDKAIAALTDGNGNITDADAKTIPSFSAVNSYSVDGKLPIDILYIHGPGTEDTALGQLYKAKMEEIFGRDKINIILGTYKSSGYKEIILPQLYDIIYDSFGFKWGDPSAQLDRLDYDGIVNNGGYIDPYFEQLLLDAKAATDKQTRYELFAKAEAYFIEEAYVIPWRATGGAYKLSYAVPFSGPMPSFGIAGYKYKGLQIQENPVTTAQYETAKLTWEEEKKNLGN